MENIILNTITTGIRADNYLVDDKYYLAPSDDFDGIHGFSKLAKNMCYGLAITYGASYAPCVNFVWALHADETSNLLIIDIIMQCDCHEYNKYHTDKLDINTLSLSVRSTLDNTHDLLRRYNLNSTKFSHPKLEYHQNSLIKDSSEVIYCSDISAVQLAKNILRTKSANLRDLNISVKPDSEVELVNLISIKPDITEDDKEIEVSCYISAIDIVTVTATMQTHDFKGSKKTIFPMSFPHSAFEILSMCFATNTEIVVKAKRKLYKYKGNTRPDSFSLIEIVKFDNKSGIPSEVIQDLIDYVNDTLDKYRL